MSAAQARKSVEKRNSTEKALSQDDEKVAYDGSASSTDSADGDEALQLVGKERTAEFSEEYNLRLRRKLVCCRCLAAMLHCLTAFGVGLDYPTALRVCVLYTVLVSALAHRTLGFTSAHYKP